MTRVIALVNQKGGVGKTTSTINIGAGLAKKGKRVLLVDLDPQGNLTYSLGIKADEVNPTVYQVMKDEATAKDAIIKGEFDVIPANIQLSGAELELSSVAGRELILKEALEPLLPDYDYILIDAPPALNMLTINALTACQEVFIPLQAEYLSLNGMLQLTNTVALVSKRLNNDLKITGVIATLYDARKNLNREVIEAIQERFKDSLFKTYIRDNIALAEAPSYGKDIFSYQPNSNGASDYLQLVDEIIKQEGGGV